MKIENKKTKEVKYFTRRDVFITWLKTQVDKVSKSDLYRFTMQDFVRKYLPDWFIVVE